MKQTLTISLLAFTILLVGCSINGISKKQHEEIVSACAGNAACVEQNTIKLRERLEYERETKRAEEHDKIRAAKINCALVNKLWVIQGHFSRSELLRMQHDDSFVPRNARLHEFACISKADFEAWMRRNGLGGF